MRVLGLVPARGGSRRLPGKNLAYLGGRTLVRRALETALAARRLTAVGLSSDDPAILREADGLPSVLTLERPAELASDVARSFDVVVDARRAAERLLETRFDAVALLQCTSPFTEPADIDGAVELMERTRAGSVLTVTEADMAYHPTKLRRLNGDRLVPYAGAGELIPSHELETFWVNTGSVYLSSSDALAAGSLVTSDVRGLQMPRRRSHDIDTAEDLEYARFLLDGSGERGD
ncbi:MAG: acylneuraminate cytidylyltransferase family protein [Solirubrobacteraceae bacterium]